MMVQVELMDMRQYNIIPDSPRLSPTVSDERMSDWYVKAMHSTPDI